MGDRAYAQLACKREDVGRFKAVGFVEDEDYDPSNDSNKWVSMVDEEANYGAYDVLVKLAKDGVAFYGYHDAGAEYDATVFASDGKGYHDALITQQENLPVVRVNPDGIVVPEDLERVKRYYAALAAAKAAH